MASHRSFMVQRGIQHRDSKEEWRYIVRSALGKSRSFNQPIYG